jgi:two-component system sensor histidine kinase/response regulator
MITAVTDESGELHGFSKVTRNISERRKAEQQLRQSEEQFRTLLECAPEAIVIADQQGVLVLVNTQAEKLFGYPRVELIGQPIEILTPALSRQRHAQHRLNYDQAPWMRQMGAGMELNGLRKSGEMFPVEVSLSPIHTPEGVWVAAGIRDITERKVAEERLIAERQRAEDANRSKADFLAAMSHEIRTPMNSILGMADMLWDSELSLDQRQYVEVFRRAGSNLLSLIDNILDFSKIESGHLELEHVDFDLEEVVDQAIELIGPKARAKGLSLMSRLVPGMATSLVGDPTRLRQILINLLGNAVKFTASGHVLLTVQSAVAAKAGAIAVAVSDTGIGIAPEKLSTVFNEFTQADKSITRRYGGSGLGLPISKRLVELIGGELKVASTLGQGSNFSFVAQFEIGAKQERTSPYDLERIHGLRVMAVDNNPVNCLILREALTSWGLAARTFEQPDAALHELSRARAVGQDYSLVIVDKHIPGTDGFELGRRIRLLAPSLPIVMISSDAEPGDIARSSKAGFAGYACKPVKRADLLRLVSQALNLSPRREAQSPGNLATLKEDTSQPVLRILIAEDSPDNQILVKAYLKGSRHAIVFVEDGLLAVEEFARTRYDLIFMDLQMPNMDGLAAARKIREIEAERGLAAVPIVALSANARREDAELSRSAGCDAHLSKPIFKGRLLAAIEEYGTRRASGDLEIGPPAPPSANRIPVPPGGGAGLPAEYIAEQKRVAVRLLELLDLNEFDQIRVAGHNLKESGDSYGVPMLTRLGSAIESTARTADLQALHVRLSELTRYLDRVSI